MFYKDINNSEIHEFFDSEYDNPIEAVVFDELTSFIENHFVTKVKKLALVDAGNCKRIEVFLYYHRDYLKLEPNGNFLGQISLDNCQQILNAAKHIIEYSQATKHFRFLKLVRLRCFETSEIFHIARTIYLSEIEDFQKLLLDHNVLRVCAPSPHHKLVLFLRNDDYCHEFEASDKCKQLHEMIYQKAKQIDTFELVSNIEKAWWYGYENIVNFHPLYNLQKYHLF